MNTPSPSSLPLLVIGYSRLVVSFRQSSSSTKILFDFLSHHELNAQFSHLRSQSQSDEQLSFPSYFSLRYTRTPLFKQ